VVVGNISVGGTGKTPVIIALIQALQKQGYRPGVVARGYGAKFDGVRAVAEFPSPKSVGDEPLLIHQITHCPVVVGANRCNAATYLLDKFGVDVVLSDDGLQHYRLARQVELAVIDGSRGLGNGWRIPVGPLRESEQRLSSVDAVLINGRPLCPVPAGEPFTIEPSCWRNVKTGAVANLESFSLAGAVAVAGIGNPTRFFDMLMGLGFNGITQSFADHYFYTAEDFEPYGQQRILMTAKDAVKCSAFAKADWWALDVKAALPKPVMDTVIAKVAHAKATLARGKCLFM